MADEWTIAPFNGPLAFDWSRDGDEWLRHLGDILSEAGGREWEGRAGWHLIEITVKSDQFTSTLRLMERDGEPWAVITGTGPDPDAEASFWRDVVTTASERVGSTHEDFDWAALVGPAAGQGYDVPLPPEDVLCGPLKLIPTNYTVWEHRSVNISARMAYEFRPIDVHGTAGADHWRTAFNQARRQLHELCALLSVARDVLWEIKYGPHFEGEERTFPPPYDPDAVPPGGTLYAGELRTEPLPAWFTDGWNRLDDNRLVRDAVAVHYEGLRLQSEHPSFAVVAFVSAIETVGQIRGARTPRARFRAGLEKLEPAETVEELVETYVARSGTAHGGKLHGGEIGGLPIWPLFFGDTGPQDFRWGTVRRIRSASKRAVAAAVARELPPLED
jgi:hypothetical protein